MARSSFRLTLRGWLRENAEPVQLWLAFRLALFILPVFAGILLPFAQQTPLPPDYVPAANVWLERLLRSWVRWDGGFYIGIARDGYAAATRTDDAAIAFFPLYPHLVRAVAWVLGAGTLKYTFLNVAGIIISSLATLACFVGLFRLALLDYDRRTGYLAVLYLAAFPLSFFMVAVYTESLFLALAVWAFWAARQNRWWLAASLTALAVLTKNQGVVLAFALGLEYLWQIRFKWRRINWRVVLSFGLPVAAFVAWLGLNWLTYGDPLRFVKVQEPYFARSFVWPHRTMLLATEQFFYQRSPGSFLPTGFDAGSVLYDYPITLAFIGLALVGAWAVWRQRLRLSYLLFLTLCIVQPLASPARENWLNGMSRFLLIAFPAFMLLALAGRRWPLFHKTYLFICLPLLGLLVTRFVLNYWVA